jgi:hypothetical protein
MKLYFVVNEASFKFFRNSEIKRFLICYYYSKDIYLKHLFRGFKLDDLFLDSGGFEALKNGAKIDVKQYVQYVKRNSDMLTVYANLDSEDIGESAGNLEFMEQEGLKPIPVWHATEPIDLFEKMSEKYPYVAVGGVEYGANKEITERITREIFPIAERNKTKIHSFGMTFVHLLRDYPFYSADSSTWTAGMRYGTVFNFDNRKNLIGKVWRDDKHFLVQAFNKAKEVGLDINESLFMKGDGREITKWNVYIWKLLSDELEQKNDTYWEEENSREAELKISKSPGDRLPPETKGKIAEIVKDPQIEAKRLARLRESLTDFRTGKYATNLPYYCNNCYVKDKCPFYQAPKNPDDKVLCALRDEFKKWFSPKDFDYREEEIVNQTRSRIINILLQRAAFNLWAELLDGGIQDKALTSLLNGIVDRLERKVPLIQQVNEGSGDIIMVPAEEVKKLAEKLSNKVKDD